MVTTVVGKTYRDTTTGIVGVATEKKTDPHGETVGVPDGLGIGNKRGPDGTIIYRAVSLTQLKLDRDADDFDGVAHYHNRWFRDENLEDVAAPVAA